MTKTFTSKRGNVALITFKGNRGNLEVVESMWDKPASRKDIRECNEWLAANNPNKGVISAEIEDDRERQALVDNILYGGQRN